MNQREREGGREGGRERVREGGREREREREGSDQVQEESLGSRVSDLGFGV